jgi:hypothetical protein
MDNRRYKSKLPRDEDLIILLNKLANDLDNTLKVISTYKSAPINEANQRA